MSLPDPDSSDSAAAAAAADLEAGLLREHLFDGELIQLPAPEEGIPGFLPEGWTGTLPVLVYPPLSHRGIPDGANVNLQVTPFHVYYGALRELAETADDSRGEQLREALLGWNERAGDEIARLGHRALHRAVETALLHFELAAELGEDASGAAEGMEVIQSFLRRNPLPDEEDGVEGPMRGFGQPTPEQQAFMEAQALTFGPEPNPARAVSLLAPLVEDHPDDAELWFVLGAAHRRTGNGPEAERCLRRATRLASGEPYAWWELSRACAQMEEWRPAEEAIRRALELEQDNPIYLCDLGRLLIKRGDLEGAEDAISRAREMVPDDPEVTEASRELALATSA